MFSQLKFGLAFVALSLSGCSSSSSGEAPVQRQNGSLQITDSGEPVPGQGTLTSEPIPPAGRPAGRINPPETDDENPTIVNLAAASDPPPAAVSKPQPKKAAPVELAVVRSEPEPPREIVDLQRPRPEPTPQPQQAAPPPRRRAGAVVGPSGGPMRERFPPSAEGPPIETLPPAPEPPPPAQPEPLRGDMFWTDRLQKNEVIEINGMTASLGGIGGRAMPGKRVEVRSFSPNVEIIRQPSGADGWSRLEFRALRNTKGSVTVNLRWYRTE